MKQIAFLLGLCCVAVPAFAQDEEEVASLDRIEVTGSRISYRDLLDTPAVAITKSGDYLIQPIQLVNDTRDKAARTREIHDTILKLVGNGRFTVLHGDAYRVELGKGNYQVELQEEGKRPDTSTVALRLRAELDGDAGRADALVASLREFVRTAPRVGRTEIDVVGETALGMTKPERYRYELIGAIARDTGQVTQALGLQCKADLVGLGSRIAWERVSSSELLLYIPYTMAIRDCVGPGNK